MYTIYIDNKRYYKKIATIKAKNLKKLIGVLYDTIKVIRYL